MEFQVSGFRPCSGTSSMRRQQKALGHLVVGNVSFRQLPSNGGSTRECVYVTHLHTATFCAESLRTRWTGRPDTKLGRVHDNSMVECGVPSRVL